MWFNHLMRSIIIIRGGGDIASGIALRLYRSGFKVLITELEIPLTVRRNVSFSEAVFTETTVIEGITARKVFTELQIIESFDQHEIPVLVDGDLEILKSEEFGFPILIEARMDKKTPEVSFHGSIPLVIGIGPGFEAGKDCHFVIESNRGHFLGRIIGQGKAQEDSGIPAGDPTRVLRSPVTGLISTNAQIGQILQKGQLIARVGNHEINAPFTGLLRGLIHTGIQVKAGMKIGDMDHRLDPDLCTTISEKAMAIGGSVLEIILRYENLKPGFIQGLIG